MPSRFAALRRPANWWELMRFSIVGGSGYVVNLVVYTAAVHGTGIGYRPAAVAAFVTAVMNNFALNRHWTFRSGRQGDARVQGIRFFAVSGAVFAIQFALLTVLVVGVGFDRVLSQALSVACCMPLSFLGNRLWSFRIAALAISTAPSSLPVPTSTD